MNIKKFFLRGLVLIIIFVLFLSPRPTHAANASSLKTQTEDDPAEQCAEGVLLFINGDWEAALPLLEAGFENKEKGNYDTLEDLGYCAIVLGIISTNLGKYHNALDAYFVALDAFEISNSIEFLGLTLSNIGAVYDFLGDSSQALDYYQKGLEIQIDIGDREGEGTTLNNIGFVYHALGDSSQALEYFQQGLDIMVEIGDQQGEGTALNNIGVVYKALGDYTIALQYYQQALDIRLEIDDRAGEGTTLNNIGAVYDYLGNFPHALEYYQQALEIEIDIGDKAGEGTTLNNIGAVYHALGDYTNARESYQQALEIVVKIGDRELEGTILNNIGFLYDNLGDYTNALKYFQQALEIEIDIGDKAGEGTTLNNIGGVYHVLGDYPRALEYFQNALEIAVEIGDQQGEGTTLNNIGGVYNELGDYPRALENYQQALEIVVEIGDRAVEGNTLSNIGAVYDDLGYFPQALEYYQQSLEIVIEIGYRRGEGITLNNIGAVYDDLGDYSQALDYYQQGLEIQIEIGNREGEGTTLNNIGFVYHVLGDYSQALDYYQQAIEVIESIQGDIQIEDLRESFSEKIIFVYDRIISLFWQEEQAEQAFNYVERARARFFLDQLANGMIDLQHSIDPTLLEEEQALLIDLRAARNRLTALFSVPHTEWDLEEIANQKVEIISLEEEYADLLVRINLQSPEVASLLSVNTATLEEVQSLLPADITLLEYYVTEELLFIFVITQNDFHASSVEISQEDLASQIDTFRNFASLNDLHPNSLQQLYKWLIEPVEEHLTTPLVGIVPHNVLHYLPFAALSDGTGYFGEEYILFDLPSASVLRFVDLGKPVEFDNILAFGNPATELPSLQFAEQEAKTIAGLFETQATTQSEATETSFYANAANADVIHLAAHGVYNPYNPLFSAIHLTGDEQEDGRLEVNEIYGLDLTENTDLVVLSACETNVGSPSAGDEIVGMTRAFMFAGTPTVISSLWNVDDEATGLLMEQFYGYLQAGMGKAEALQRAQLDVRDDYPHPYYWAGFVLTGDPGEAGTNIDGLEERSSIWNYIIVGGVLFLGVFVIWKKSRSTTV